VGGGDDDTAERLDESWRVRCRADPLVSRGRQPSPRNSLPGKLVQAVRNGEDGPDAFAREAPNAIDERLSAEEALRQLSLLAECHGEQVCGDAAALSRLVAVVSRGHEAIAGTYLAASDERARRDDLTGLLNRRMYEPERERAVDAAARGRGTALLINFDLNAFSVVNNTLGHDRGDLFLKHAADLIDRTVRALGGQAYRIGGDEFVAILRDVERAAVENAILQLIAQPECPPMSFGISAAPDDVDDARSRAEGEQTIGQALGMIADDRMYEMKHARNDQERADLTAEWLQ